jgi:signal transduction histidine kinase
MKHCRVNIDIPIHKLFLSFNRSFFGVFTLLIVNNTLSLLWGLTYFLWVVAAILWLVRMLVLENRSTRAIVCFVALMLVVVVFCATVIVVALATMLVTVTLVVMLLIAVIIMVVTFMIMTVTFVVVTVVTFMAMFVNIVVVTVTVVMIMSAAIVILASQMVVSVPRVQDFDLDQVEDETNDRHNKHRESFHLRRLIKSMRSLDDQPNSHYPHRRNRDHSSDNFCSVPPIRQRVSLTLLR